MGRFRRVVEQQELGGNFVDKLVEPKIGEEAAPAARRDESAPIPLFRSASHNPIVQAWYGETWFVELPQIT